MRSIRIGFLAAPLAIAGCGQAPPAVPVAGPPAVPPALLPKVVIHSPRPESAIDGLQRLSIRGMVQDSDAYIFWHGGALLQVVGTTDDGQELIYDTALAPLKKAAAPGWCEFEAELDNLPKRPGTYTVQADIDVVRRGDPDEGKIKDRLVRLPCDRVQLKLADRGM